MNIWIIIAIPSILFVFFSIYKLITRIEKIKKLNMNDLATMDELITHMSDSHVGTWEPIDTCPFDQDVHLWHRDKNIHHIVKLKFPAGTDLKSRGYTHWRLRFPDPNDA